MVRAMDAPAFQSALFEGLEELRVLQLKRLRETIRRAYERVPHYRAAFGGAGLRPDDLTGLGDLPSFPLTTKEALRQSYPF